MDDLYRPNYDQLIEDAREFHRTFRDGFDDLEEFLKEVRRSFRSGDDAAQNTLVMFLPWLILYH